MSGLALGIVTALYAWQMVVCLLAGQIGQFLILLGYTIANVGLIVVVVK